MSMMSDSISRKDAINALTKEWYHCQADMKTTVQVINALPSADRATEKWNRLSHDTFHCNLCGRTFIVIQGEDAMNYCPNCGTDMRGEA